MLVGRFQQAGNDDVRLQHPALLIAQLLCITNRPAADKQQ